MREIEQTNQPNTDFSSREVTLSDKESFLRSTYPAIDVLFSDETLWKTLTLNDTEVSFFPRKILQTLLVKRDGNFRDNSRAVN